MQIFGFFYHHLDKVGGGGCTVQEGASRFQRTNIFEYFRRITIGRKHSPRLSISCNLTTLARTESTEDDKGVGNSFRLSRLAVPSRNNEPSLFMEKNRRLPGLLFREGYAASKSHRTIGIQHKVLPCSRR